MNTALEMDSSQQELHRLLLWAKDNEADWYRICNPACYDPSMAYLTDLVERLYQAKLYTVLFFVIYANHIQEGVDWAITRTVNECFLDMPMGVLLERFRNNLKIRVAEDL